MKRIPTVSKLSAIVFSFSFLIMSCSTRDASPPEPSEKQEERSLTPLHETMYKVLSNITRLQDLAVSEEKFKKKENQAEIKTLIENLADNSSEVLRHKRVHTPAYRISGTALQNHFKDLKRTYNWGNLEYSRRMIAATPMACASCHTQLPNSPKPLWEISGKDVMGSPIEKADLLFATRNYNEAIKYYNLVVREFEGTTEQFGSNDLARSLKRKMNIFVRVKRDFTAARKNLDEDLKNKRLPKTIAQDMKEWQSALAIISKKKRFNRLPQSAKDTLEWAEYVLSSSEQSARTQMIELLFLSGLLYESLHKNPETELTPEILYRLAVVDSRLNRELFFSLSHAYLRECMDMFPTSRTAKRCFGEFEISMRDLYSGTRGYDPPFEVDEELRERKAKLNID